MSYPADKKNNSVAHVHDFSASDPQLLHAEPGLICGTAMICACGKAKCARCGAEFWPL